LRNLALCNRCIDKATRNYEGNLTAARVSILGYDLYLIQDRESIRNIWKSPSLSSPIPVTLFAFRYLFGVPQQVMKLYREDNSGPFHKPFEGSNIAPDRRIDYLSHQEFLRALSGPGLAPLFERFRTSFGTRLDGIKLSDEWVDGADFRKLLQSINGAPLVEGVFGPALLRLNPTFVDDLYEFDASVPWLSRGMPSFIMPWPYRARRRLYGHFKRWHSYVSHASQELSSDDQGGEDPVWGSRFMKNRHAMLLKCGVSNDSLAALDLGLSFGYENRAYQSNQSLTVL
jgi:hypothetical protein